MPNRRRLTREERRAVYETMGGHCAYCGCELSYKNMQVDHILPLRKGGADDLSNMLPSCQNCNHYKGALDVEQFRHMIEKTPETLAKYNTTFRNAVRFGLVLPMPQEVAFYFEREEVDCD